MGLGGVGGGDDGEAGLQGFDEAGEVVDVVWEVAALDGGEAGGGDAHEVGGLFDGEAAEGAEVAEGGGGVGVAVAAVLGLLVLLHGLLSFCVVEFNYCLFYGFSILAKCYFSTSKAFGCQAFEIHEV